MLSRTAITGSTIDFTGAEKMILDNFGHGETLDMVPNSGTNPTFWITTDSGSEKYGDDFWGRQIGLIQFDPSVGTVDYTDIKRLSSISSANSTGTAAFKIERCDAALSSDGARLIIMGAGTDDTRQLTCYETNVINQLFNESSNGVVDCSKAPMTTSYGSGGALVSSYPFVHHLHWDSDQGLEFSNDNKVYITGGDQNATSPELPHILKGDWRFTDGNYETISFNLPNPGIIETEGIQLYGDNVYVGVEFHENGDGEARHTIYSFAKSEFSV